MALMDTLARVAMYDAERRGQALPRLTQSIRNLGTTLERNKLKTLTKEFISRGDYSPEAIKRFGQENNLSVPELQQIMGVAGDFLKYQRASQEPLYTVKAYDSNKDAYYQKGVTRDELQKGVLTDIARPKMYEVKRYDPATKQYHKVLVTGDELRKGVLTGVEGKKSPGSDKTDEWQQAKKSYDSIIKILRPKGGPGQAATSILSGAESPEDIAAAIENPVVVSNDIEFLKEKIKTGRPIEQAAAKRGINLLSKIIGMQTVMDKATGDIYFVLPSGEKILYAKGNKQPAVNASTLSNIAATSAPQREITPETRILGSTAGGLVPAMQDEAPAAPWEFR